MTVPLTQWYDRVAAGLRLCPNPLIKKELIDVLRFFCKETCLWYEQLEDIDTVAEQASYALTSSNGDVASIRRAELSGVRLDPTSETVLDRESTDWRTKIGAVDSYFMGADRNIRLVYKPVDAVTDGLAVWVNLMPLLTATEVEDFIFNDYRDIITLGTRARLLAHPDRPWSAPAAAMAYEEKFMAQVDEVKRDANQLYTPATTRQTLRSRASAAMFF